MKKVYKHNFNVWLKKNLAIQMRAQKHIVVNVERKLSGCCCCSKNNNITLSLERNRTLTKFLMPR